VTDLSIRFETLTQTHGDLTRAHTTAQDAIAELKAKLDQSLASWTGDAQEIYQQVKADWDASFARMALVLQRAQGHIANAHEIFTSAERDNARIWQ
jgi:WXG100 family type VII secretion target